MRRRVCYRVLAVCAAGFTSTAVALGATSGSVKLTVSPKTGTSRTRFEVSFTAPRETGGSGLTAGRYTITVSARSARGCTSSRAVAVPATHSGEHVHVTIAPQQPSRVWCAGSYAGVLNETIRPVCTFREICPDFIIIRTAGRFSFRVSGSTAVNG